MANPKKDIPGRVNGSILTCATKTVSKKRIIAFTKRDVRPNVMRLRGIDKNCKTGLRISIIRAKIMPVTIYVCNPPDKWKPDKICVVVKSAIV